jgi:hypothetical protein
MIPAETLQSKSLFSLLFKIDLDLAERTRALGCPIAGVHCIALPIGASLGVAPRIFARHLKLVSVCAAAVKAAGVVCCRPRCFSGAAGCTGHR